MLLLASWVVVCNFYHSGYEGEFIISIHTFAYVCQGLILFYAVQLKILSSLLLQDSQCVFVVAMSAYY